MPSLSPADLAALTTKRSAPRDTPIASCRDCRRDQRKESEIQREVIAALNREPGVRVWRSNVGAFGREYKGRPRFVRFGFRGLSDLVGYQEGIVQEERWYKLARWTGRYLRIARFVAVEVKRPGQKPSIEQQAFLDAVRVAGGIAGVVTSADEAVRLVRGEEETRPCES